MSRSIAHPWPRILTAGLVSAATCLTTIWGLVFLWTWKPFTGGEPTPAEDREPFTPATDREATRSGNPGPEDPRPVRYTCELPRPLKEGVYDGGQLVVKQSKGVNYIWATIGGLRKGQLGEITFKNLPRAAPVAAYFCEWDPVGQVPLLGNVRTILAEVVRRPGQIRVRGYQDHGTHTCAMGLIVAEETQ